MMSISSYGRRRTTRRLADACAIALLMAASWQSRAGAEFQPGEPNFAAQRELAAQQLERARETVAKARSAAAEARTRLDQFVGQHFDGLRMQVETPLAVPAQAKRAAVPRRSPAADATAEVEAQWLKEQIQELTTQRNALTRQYTAEHPAVADIGLKLSELTQRLAAITRPKADGDTPQGADSSVLDATVDSQLVAQLTADKERHQEAVRQYQALMLQWQVAERNLQAAEDDAANAAEKLAAIDAAIAITAVNEEREAPDAAAGPSASKHRAAAADAPGAAERPRQGSSPLIAAAFLVALLVAAVAAVKLARATSDATFNSVDEAAAALALPVVGVIPRGASSSSTSRTLAPMPSGIVVLGEVLAALFVFALVAYCVQNPDFLWTLCTNPLECFR